MYTYEDSDNDPQSWYIYGESGAYCFRSKCTDCVIDITGGSLDNGANAQMYTYNGSTAQKFQIWKLDNWSQLGCIQDVGTDFCAYIINTEAWKHLTVETDNNVTMRDEVGEPSQIWRFTQKSDGSYKIVNCKTSQALDSTWSNEPGTNLYTYEDSDNDPQSWYIYGESGAYYFKSKCTDCVIDITGGSLEDGANAQMYTYNGSTSQKFQIWKLDNWSQLGCIQDVGTDFCAYIINTEAWKHLTVETDNNVTMRDEVGEPSQIWRFTQKSDGSYKIVNCKTLQALDSTWSNEPGANVYTCEDSDNAPQSWYIYGVSGAYYFRSKCTDCVMDVSGGYTEDGTNVQMYTKNDTTAQKFQIWKLENYVEQIPGDLNSDSTLTTADAVLLQKYLLNQTTLTETQYNLADLNADGAVNGFDLALLRQKLLA